VLTELSDIELALVAGGQGTPTLPVGAGGKKTLFSVLRVIDGVILVLPTFGSGFNMAQRGAQLSF
jgi:hypothetical protein